MDCENHFNITTTVWQMKHLTLQDPGPVDLSSLISSHSSNSFGVLPKLGAFAQDTPLAWNALSWLPILRRFLVPHRESLVLGFYSFLCIWFIHMFVSHTRPKGQRLGLIWLCLHHWVRFKPIPLAPSIKKTNKVPKFLVHFKDLSLPTWYFWY